MMAYIKLSCVVNKLCRPNVPLRIPARWRLPLQQKRRQKGRLGLHTAEAAVQAVPELR